MCQGLLSTAGRGKAHLKISLKWCLYFLSVGDVILLGKTNMLRFNHPQEAAKLRKKRYVSSILDRWVRYSYDINHDNLKCKNVLWLKTVNSHELSAISL